MIFLIISPFVQYICPNTTLKKTLINDDNVNAFKRKLKDMDWSVLYKINDVNTCYEIYFKNCLNLFRK